MPLGEVIQLYTSENSQGPLSPFSPFFGRSGVAIAAQEPLWKGGDACSGANKCGWQKRQTAPLNSLE